MLKQATERPTDMLTTDEAAAYIGLQPTTLETWRSTKRVALPYTKLGRSVRYRRRDLDAYLDRHTVAEQD